MSETEKEYVIHDSKVYIATEIGPIKGFSPLKTQPRKVDNLKPQWVWKKIPYAMWRRLVGWAKLTSDEFQSEGLALLFYDTNNAEEPWSVWFPPQSGVGMTVESKPDDPRFAEQRRNYPDLMLGTCHDHCSGSAFASGTDNSDELSREGLHITIGNVKEDKLSTDVRLILQNQKFDKIGITAVIEPPDWVLEIPEKYRDKIDLEAILLEGATKEETRKEDYPLDNYEKTSLATGQWPQRKVWDNTQRKMVDVPLEGLEKKTQGFTDTKVIGGTTTGTDEEDEEEEPQDSHFITLTSYKGKDFEVYVDYWHLFDQFGELFYKDDIRSAPFIITLIERIGFTMEDLQQILTIPIFDELNHERLSKKRAKRLLHHLKEAVLKQVKDQFGFNTNFLERSVLTAMIIQHALADLLYEDDQNIFLEHFNFHDYNDTHEKARN